MCVSSRPASPAQSSASDSTTPATLADGPPPIPPPSSSSPSPPSLAPATPSVSPPPPPASTPRARSSSSSAASSPPPREEALQGIFGYTAGNDVSARDWQGSDGQWWRAKGTDTFGVYGPTIATGLDHEAIEVRTRVNGEETQHGRSDELILDIPEIVRYVTAVITLVPGDIIYSGTPGQPQSLNPGDTVEVEVTGAGVLSNPVVAGR